MFFQWFTYLSFYPLKDVNEKNLSSLFNKIWMIIFQKIKN